MSSVDLSIQNIGFVEELYREFLRDPSSVAAPWRTFFEEHGDPADAVAEPKPFVARSIFSPAPGSTPSSEAEHLNTSQDRVDQLIRAYRFRGHMIAELDPLGQPRPVPPELDPGFYALPESDMDRRFSCESLGCTEHLTLREILQVLRNTYCRSIGVEYMHIDDLVIRRWLQQRMEGTQNRFQISRDQQVRILTRLTDAVMFEEFIRRKFIGAKSFSLEGSESLIPLLDLAIEKAAEQGVTEIDVGMAHRGRLNVLANIMGKHPKQIFREFADLEPEKYRGRGDVKYHLGHSTEWQTNSGKQVHLSLSFNPSHLEFVNPVVLGRTRANQDRAGDSDRVQVMALLIHGDAAFAGQGVSQEILNLSQLPGYRVGGALHVVVNNQIGFTTSPPEGRSTAYATDVAKMLQIPIFHVNGENPEAVAQCVNLAMDFRNAFKRDVVIDMYGYRRLGHNEADEPSFTQPLLYKAIEQRKPVREGYLDHLLKMNEITREEADKIADSRRERLETALSESRRTDYKLPTETVRGPWSKYVGGSDLDIPEAETAVAVEKLSSLLLKQTQLPADFTPHPKIKKLLEARTEMAKGNQPIDWAVAEALAFGSLAAEGFRVRLSGQDVLRGTFSHRHSALFDFETGRVHVPLQHLAKDQGPVEIRNSPLSEVGVLGFEYGYSLEWPDGLVVWEAQFGDFWNVAQVIVDQFLSSAEKKWRRLSGLVLLLPHGFEGQGPEHSSARLERFMALAAEDNIQVANPTTPAQYYHLLRRQVLRKIRKPLVVMSPKSLLRHPKVVSRLDECASGTFQPLLADTTVPAEKVERILLCSGKIYYELEKRREELKRVDVAILRLEQLYPLHDATLHSALEVFRANIPLVWVQEEPENMGAWRSLRVRFGERVLGRHPLHLASRPASASPATGSANSHKQEQEQIIATAFGDSFNMAKVSQGNLGKENGEHEHRVESASSGRVDH